MVAERKRKNTWERPRIIFDSPFENTAAGNPGFGGDLVSPSAPLGNSES